MCTFISLNSHNHTVKEVLLLFPYPRWRHWGIGMLSHLSEARVRPRLIYAKQWGPIFDNYQGRNCFCSLSNDAPWISPSSRVWLWLSETVLWQGIWRGERSYKTRRWSRGGSEKLNASDRAVVTAFFHYLSIILLFGHILEFTSGTSLSGLQIAGGHNCKMYIYPLPLHDSFLPNAPN